MRFLKKSSLLLSLFLPFASLSAEGYDRQNPCAEFNSMLPYLETLGLAFVAVVCVLAVGLVYFFSKLKALKSEYPMMAQVPHLAMRTKMMSTLFILDAVMAIISTLGFAYLFARFSKISPITEDSFKAFLDSFAAQENVGFIIMGFGMAFSVIMSVFMGIFVLKLVLIYKCWEPLPSKFVPFPIILPVLLMIIPLANIAGLAMNTILITIYLDRSLKIYGRKTPMIMLVLGAALSSAAVLGIFLGIIHPYANWIVNIFSPMLSLYFFAMLTIESLRLSYMKERNSALSQ
jgi:hypothetical protein